MCKQIALICLLLFREGNAQAPYSPVQYLRLEEAGKVWGHIKYLHPFVQHHSINWDSAFAAVAPTLLESTSKLAYAKHIQGWLSLLDDPLTGVVTSNTPKVKIDTTAYPIAHWKDSVLTITIRSLQGFTNFNNILSRLEAFAPLFSKAKGILFDFRPVDNGRSDDLAMEDYFAYSGIEPYLTDTVIQKPAVRRIAYTGFPPEDELSGSAYYPYYTTKIGATVFPKLLRKCPIVFLVNENVDLPLIALSLQESRRAIVLNEGDYLNLKDITLPHYLPDSLLLKIRVAELVNATGASLEYFQRIERDEQGRNQEKALSMLRHFINAFDGNKPAKVQIETKPHSASFGYNTPLFPHLGYRALAAAKIFTVIDYFFPYKNLMEYSWDSIYHKLLPQFITAKDSVAYSLAVAKMYRFYKTAMGSLMVLIPGKINFIPVHSRRPFMQK